MGHSLSFYEQPLKRFAKYDIYKFITTIDISGAYRRYAPYGSG
jgi:hypothetical protein